MKAATRSSFWAAIGRLVGVFMGAGAGSLMYQTIGSSTNLAIGIASTMFIISFFLMWYAEYKRIQDDQN